MRRGPAHRTGSWSAYQHILDATLRAWIILRLLFVVATALATAILIAPCGSADAESVASLSPLPFKACGPGYYENSDGACIQVPTQAPSAPPGATAQCGDGSYSFSANRSGTCSGHGGVSQWLNASPPMVPLAPLLLPGAVVGSGSFVALAIEPNTAQGGWGTAASLDRAIQIAVAQCQTATGLVCQVAAHMQNGCAAVAVDATVGMWRGGYGLDPTSAGINAIGALPAGRVIAVQCSSQ